MLYESKYMSYKPTCGLYNLIYVLHKLSCPLNKTEYVLYKSIYMLFKPTCSLYNIIYVLNIIKYTYKLNS